MIAAKGIRLNGRGVAAADVANDGRMDIAINTIGGKLVLLHPFGPEWALARRAAVPVCPGRGRHRRAAGRQAVDADRAGRQQLSLVGGPAHPLRPRRGDFGPLADGALSMGWARARAAMSARTRWCGSRPRRPSRSPRRELRPPCLRTARPHRRAVARSRGSGTTRRSTCSGWAAHRSRSRRATSSTLRQRPRRPGTRPAGSRPATTAISYAAYRLLVWRASYGANVDQAFARLTGRLRALCLSPDFTDTSGGSAAEVGNRIGAAAIAAGRNDGSNEALHYADPSYTPLNAPLVVARPRLDGARRDVLAAAGALAEGGPGRRLRPGQHPDVRELTMGRRAHVRTTASRPPRQASATRRAPPTSGPRSQRSAPRRRPPRRSSSMHPRSPGTESPGRCRPGEPSPRASPATSGSISR